MVDGDYGERAWILMTKSDAERSWAANSGYDDSVGIYYSYDSNVANSLKIQAGDVIVVRVDDYVAGWGIAERIEISPNAPKSIMRCPKCRKTNFYRRKTSIKQNRCSSCKNEFDDDEALVTIETVTAFRCFYANTWIEAARPVYARDIGEFYATRDTFNAMRPLIPEKLTELLDLLSGRSVDLKLDILDSVLAEIVGGRTTAIIRRRRGQREFRFKMMDRFGESCAFSGNQPPQVLEAAHLYSFAKKPEHHKDGGLLLRRDFHALFDSMLVTVNPTSWRIEIAPRLESFNSYRALQGAPLLVAESKRPNRTLIADHYEQAERVFQHN